MKLEVETPAFGILTSAFSIYEIDPRKKTKDEKMCIPGVHVQVCESEIHLPEASSRHQFFSEKKFVETNMVQLT